MELKIICQCGQKYKFDVEPVNGRMPVPVNCPVCQADGTATANIMLAHQLAIPPKLGPASSVAQPPAPVIPVPPPPPPIKAAPPTMAARKIDQPPPPAPARKAPITESTLAGAERASAATATSVQAPAAIKTPDAFSMGRGVLGALVGSAAGCGFFYWMFLWSQLRLPLTGCAVGAAAGGMARLLARRPDSKLGAFTATIAVLSLAGPCLEMYRDFPLTGIISLLVSAGVAYRISSD